MFDRQHSKPQRLALLEPFADKGAATMLTALRWIVFRDITIRLITAIALVGVAYYGGPPVANAVLKHLAKI